MSHKELPPENGPIRDDGSEHEGSSFPEGIFAELHELVDACLQATATPEQVARLNGILETDARARWLYVRYLQTSFSLRNWSESVHEVLSETADCPLEAAAKEVRKDRQAQESREEPPPVSPVLGFLGDLSRQSWGYINDHTLWFSILAVLVIVGAVAFWKEEGGRPGKAGRGSWAVDSGSAEGGSERGRSPIWNRKFQTSPSHL